VHGVEAKVGDTNICGREKKFFVGQMQLPHQQRQISIAKRTVQKSSINEIFGRKGD
jgi:hypothetical protein